MTNLNSATAHEAISNKFNITCKSVNGWDSAHYVIDESEFNALSDNDVNNLIATCMSVKDVNCLSVDLSEHGALNDRCLRLSFVTDTQMDYDAMSMQLNTSEV